MIKSSSVSMEGRKLIKRNQKRKCVEINNLPNDVLVHILSRMSLKEAARTSVLAHKWRYLWRFVTGTLQFEFKDFVTAAGDLAEVEKFTSCVNSVLELHQGGCVEGLTILFEGLMHDQQYKLVRKMAPTIDNWVFFAAKKQVERLDLILSVNHKHDFPSTEALKSHSHAPFSRLRTLRLLEVQIRDEVVSYLLASCPYLEDLCVCWSNVTKNIRVVDPPRMRALEIRACRNINCVEISAESLVSLSYTGGENDLVLKKIPNLRELTIGSRSFMYFIRVVKEHFNPFDKLVKLVVDHTAASSRHPLTGLPDFPRFAFLKRLEVRVYSVIGRSLLYFTSLIEASPQLCEFRIEMSYQAFLGYPGHDWSVYPAISRAEAMKFDHRSLKTVEMAGHVGCSSEHGLLHELVDNAPSIERVCIDTRSGYYDDPSLAEVLKDWSSGDEELGATTRAESVERAKNLVSTLPHHIEFIIS